MTRDKQLKGIDIEAVSLKQKLDQALNIKEFAVLAGVSHSVGREWFLLTGFPTFRGKVFWQDFVLWRRSQNPSKNSLNASTVESHRVEPVEVRSSSSRTSQQWPARAAKILAEQNNSP